MVLNSLIPLMDETTLSGILSTDTHLQLPKPIFHNDPTQLSSIFKGATTQIPLEFPPPTSADHNNQVHNRNRKSISSTNHLNEFLKPHSILTNNNSSESDDDDAKHDEINLYPLANQVGGHTRLLLLNDKTVIKPLNIRELEFYQNIPGNDIQHFVPKYKGIVNSRQYQVLFDACST